MADFKLTLECRNGGPAQQFYTDIEGCETAQDALDEMASLEGAWISLGGVAFHRTRLVAIEEHPNEGDEE